LNALTKVFVILLVICSLLLTAATIVFVNRMEDFQTMNKDLTSQLGTERTLAQSSEAELLSVKQDQAAKLDAAAKQVEAIRAQRIEVSTQLAAAQTQLAEKGKEFALLQLDVNRLTEAMKASEDARGKIQDTLAEARKSLDQTNQQNSGLNAQVSDLTNKLDQVTKEWKFLKEQLQDAKEKLAQAEKGGGAGTQGAMAPAAGGAANVKLNGIIRNVKPIDGIPYATISLGSADQVSKGMEFNVINRAKGEWLGTLIVTSVEPNEATGRLEGPKVDQVQSGPNYEVRTQL
jgi:hypothetical protein